MTKKTKIKVCDWALVAITPLMLASSIQLEGWWLGMAFIWTHIALGIAFFALLIWHLLLHFQWRDLVGRLRQMKSPVTRWLALFGTVTLLTAIAATVHMFITWHHTAIGGWHGKFGFVFIALAIGHALKRKGRL